MAKRRIARKIFLGVLLFIIAAVLMIALVLFTVFPRRGVVRDVQASRDEATVARGKYLAVAVYQCRTCHSNVNEEAPGLPPRDGAAFTGRRFADVETPFGPVRVSGTNLTTSHAGLADWSDGEIIRAIREGISKNGEPIIAMMPYAAYRESMPMEDALAIVAYLRSLPPTDAAPPRSQIPKLLRTLLRSFPKPVEKDPLVPPTDPLGRGQWLLQVAECATCHTNARKGLTFGGQRYPEGNKEVVVPNITSDPAFGVGAFSDDELRRAIFECTGKRGPLHGMPCSGFAEMNDTDKAALISAVRAIPPINASP